MIYYFSGTGNSKWAAEELAGQLGDQVADMASLMNTPAPHSPILIDSNSTLGLVFPVYAWRMPAIVEAFAKRLVFDETVYTFALCTCGDEAGRTIDIFKKILRIDSGYSLAMPNNFIVLGTDSLELASQKVKAAAERLKHISQAIAKKEAVFDVHHGSLPGLKSAVIGSLFNAGRNFNFFKAESTCTGCGLCEKNCPISCISMKNGKPTWNKGCTMCFGCINRCPNQAIQYTKITKNKDRYYFEMLP